MIEFSENFPKSYNKIREISGDFSVQISDLTSESDDDVVGQTKELQKQFKEAAERYKKLEGWFMIDNLTKWCWFLIFAYQLFSVSSITAVNMGHLLTCGQRRIENVWVRGERGGEAVWFGAPGVVQGSAPNDSVYCINFRTLVLHG